MIGQVYKCPTEICDSGFVKVVGQEETSNRPVNTKRGPGPITYHCVELKDGVIFGRSFCVGSDELKTWKRVA